MRTLTCPICSRDFTTNYSRQVNCSKECAKVSVVKTVKLWRESNPKMMRSNDLRKRYWPHLSNQEAMAEYNLLLKSQDSKCAICGDSEANRQLSVDHCHKTGKVRGLLCSRCNTALGLLRDDVQIVKNLETYLVT